MVAPRDADAVLHQVAEVAAAGRVAAGAGAAMRYFLAYELPKVEPWLAVAARREPLCRELDPDVL